MSLQKRQQRVFAVGSESPRQTSQGFIGIEVVAYHSQGEMGHG